MRNASFALLLALVCASGAATGQDYAAWKTINKEGSWTRAAEKAVAETPLATLVPKDIKTFCSAYKSADAERRTRFWVGLLSAMAKPESNFRPATQYVEPEIFDANKQHVISRGLLQISMESANQKAYGCGITNAQSLHDIDVNLTCAARIMEHWVRTDGVIAATSRPPVGAARYWSVLRGWRGHLVAISAFTRSMDVCKP